VKSGLRRERGRLARMLAALDLGCLPQSPENLIDFGKRLF